MAHAINVFVNHCIAFEKAKLNLFATTNWNLADLKFLALSSAFDWCGPAVMSISFIIVLMQW